jgi:hypothetical protein
MFPPILATDLQLLINISNMARYRISYNCFMNVEIENRFVRMLYRQTLFGLSLYRTKTTACFDFKEYSGRDMIIQVRRSPRE